MFKHIQNPFQFKFQGQVQNLRVRILVRRCDPIVDRLRSDRPIGEILDEKNHVAAWKTCSLCLEVARCVFWVF